MDLAGRQRNIEKYFKKIECSDESFFGTLFHSVSKGHTQYGTTYVNWSGSGGPKDIQFADLERVSQSGQLLFARKFTSSNKQILVKVNSLKNFVR